MHLSCGAMGNDRRGGRRSSATPSRDWNPSRDHCGSLGRPGAGLDDQLVNALANETRTGVMDTDGNYINHALFEGQYRIER